jgi:LacI family transcriptional regulator
MIIMSKRFGLCKALCAKMAPNLKTISQRVGCSIPTVSQILSGQGKERRYAAATIEKVRTAAKELGYKPNVMARGLVGGKTHAVGAIRGTISDNSPDTCHVVEDRLSRRHYVTYVSNSMHKLEIAYDILDDFARRGVDGVLLWMSPGWEKDEKLMAMLDEFPAALLVTADSQPQAFDRVIHDRSSAFRKVVDHFVKTGRRRPALMTVEQAGTKTEAFESQLATYGIQMKSQGLLIDLDWGLWQESVSSCCTKALDGRFQNGHLPFDALMCISDGAAVAAMTWLRKKGLRIPNDVAVVGFNDNDFCKCFDPPLASISRRAGKVAETIEQMFFNRLMKPDAPVQCETVEMEFVWRESAG